MKIAILGFGTVGQGIYKILEECRENLEAKAGDKISLQKILVRNTKKARGLPLEDLPLTDSFTDILDDDSIAVVFEVMSDGQKGVEYNRLLLEKGKHVISANKAAVAAAFFELQNAARSTNSHLRFEAAVAGGIPLLDPLSKITCLNEIAKIKGILNGSTNYILSELAKGRAKDEVYKQAATLGVLEEDPTDDVEGFDARRKIAILAAMVLRAKIDEKSIPTIGISQLTANDFYWAKSEGLAIKLIANFSQSDEGYNLSVIPTALPLSDALSQTGGVMNQVMVKGDRIGELSFFGAGGGMYPTAHALWVDFLDVVNSEPLYYLKNDQGLANNSLSRSSQFYLRAEGEIKGKIETLKVSKALDYAKKDYAVIERV